MRKLIIKLLVTTIAALVASYLLGGVHIDTVWTAFVLAIVLGILNAIVKPILVIITIPATILTLGLFLLVINAIIIFMADSLVDGFQVDNFWWALGFSFIVSIVTSFLEGKDKKEEA